MHKLIMSISACNLQLNFEIIGLLDWNCWTGVPNFRLEDHSGHTALASRIGAPRHLEFGETEGIDGEETR